LFSLIGTTFGGDGQVTFGLPDYRGRVPISAGTHAGITYTLGEQAGVENVTLTSNQMPIHTHTVNADSTAGTSKGPKNALIASDAGKIPQYGVNARTTGSATEISPAGGSQSHSILQPYNTFHWIISLYGIYPTQNQQSDKKEDSESQK
ncbi:MAG: tail fiber protein, partial [bacterium]